MRGLARGVVGLGLVAMAGAGCGGNTPVKPSAQAGTPTGSTAGATPTKSAAETTAATGRADLALAAKGVLAKGDLPPDWSRTIAGSGAIKAVRQTRSGCSVAKGQLPAWAVAYDGGTYRKGKLQRSVSVSSATFRDEATAKSFVAKLRTATYVTCAAKAKADEVAKNRKAAPGSTWRAGPVEAGSGAREAILHFIYQARVNGKVIDANGREDVSVYRFGRVVTLFSYTSVRSENEPRDIVRATDVDLRNAASRIQQRSRS